MKKFILLVVVFLMGCTEVENVDFSVRIDNYLSEKEFEVIERIVVDSGEIISFESNADLGAIYFSEESFLEKTVLSSKEYDKGLEVELLCDEVRTYFVIVIHEEEIYNKGDKVVITLLDKEVPPIELDLGDSYQKVWITSISGELTDCALDKVEIFDGAEVRYVEAFIPS